MWTHAFVIVSDHTTFENFVQRLYIGGLLVPQFASGNFPCHLIWKRDRPFDRLKWRSLISALKVGPLMGHLRMPHQHATWRKRELSKCSNAPIFKHEQARGESQSNSWTHHHLWAISGHVVVKICIPVRFGTWKKISHIFHWQLWFFGCLESKSLWII